MGTTYILVLNFFGDKDATIKKQMLCQPNHDQHQTIGSQKLSLKILQPTNVCMSTVHVRMIASNFFYNWFFFFVLIMQICCELLIVTLYDNRKLS